MKLSILKQLAALVFVGTFITGSLCADDTALKEGLMMKAGKMMVMKEGKTMEMMDSMTLSDGTMVMKDGTVMMKDGKKMMMKDGDTMSLQGKMTSGQKPTK